MKKIIKQWGNSLVIVFNSEEAKRYKLSAKDLVLVKIIKLKTKALVHM